MFRTSVESNQWLKNCHLLLPRQASRIIRIGQGLTGSVSWYCDWVGYQLSCHAASGLVSQWASIMKLSWVRSVTSQYPSWYDLRCCQDIKLQQQTKSQCNMRSFLTFNASSLFSLHFDWLVRVLPLSNTSIYAIHSQHIKNSELTDKLLLTTWTFSGKYL